MTPLAIAGRPLGADHPPLIVAELSGNHNQSLDRARRLMDAAAAAGAEAVKLQSYTPDTITLDHNGPGFRITQGLWAGRTLYDLYAEAHTPFEWHAPLFEHARGLGLIVFSSPFDASAVDLLQSLDAPAYKIASFELIDLPLVERAAATGRPLILSTGMSSSEEIGEAAAAARAAGSGGIVLLHCVSAYPSKPRDAHLRTMRRLADDYGCLSGLSDHTPGSAVAVAATALGAVLIEKHVTLDRGDGGPDSSFSLEPSELARLVVDCRDAFDALGEANLVRTPEEGDNRQFRRSLYVVRDVSAGRPLSAADVRSIRPGFGLAPKHLGAVLGRCASRDLKRGEPFAWEMLQTPSVAAPS
jgi:N-acetylneuraminate synthase